MKIYFTIKNLLQKILTVLLAIIMVLSVTHTQVLGYEETLDNITYDLSLFKNVASLKDPDLYDNQFYDGQFIFEVLLDAPEGQQLNSQYEVEYHQFDLKGEQETSQRTEAVNVQNNIIKLTIGHRELAIIKNLPANTQYKITELESEGYSISWYEESKGFKDANIGILDKSKEIICFNQIRDDFSLKISETLAHSQLYDIVQNLEFTFDIELIAPDGVELKDEYDVCFGRDKNYAPSVGQYAVRWEKIKLNNGHLSFKLYGGQNAFISSLPKGTQYKVTQTDNNNLTTRWKGDTQGVINKDITLNCINKEHKIQFSIYKSFQAIDFPEPQPPKVEPGQPAPQSLLNKNQVMTVNTMAEQISFKVNAKEASGAEFVIYEYNEDTGKIGQELARSQCVAGESSMAIYSFSWEIDEFNPGPYVLKEVKVPVGKQTFEDDDYWLIKIGDWNETSLEDYIAEVKGSNAKMDNLFGIMQCVYGSTKCGVLFIYNFDVNLYDLTIEKEVSKSLANDETFEFDIKLTAPKSGQLDTEYEVTIQTTEDSQEVSYQKMTLEDGHIKVMLKNNQKAIIHGLPEGIQYEVNETESHDYVSSWEKNMNSGILKEDTTLHCINSLPTGTLTVSKTVTGNAADKGKDFIFTVILDDTTINETYGDMTFKDGQASFTLKHKESISATGLPVGIKYRVEESDNDDYIVTKENEEGIIIANEEIKVNFINHKSYKGGLRVTNHVIGKGDKNKDFYYTVTLSGKTITGLYGDMYFENGIAEFTLKDKESLIAIELPENLSYIVVETDNEGYTVTMKGETGNLIANEIVDIIFINDLDTLSQPTQQEQQPKPELSEILPEPNDKNEMITNDYVETTKPIINENITAEDTINIVNTSDNNNLFVYGLSMVGALAVVYVLKKKQKEML